MHEYDKITVEVKNHTDTLKGRVETKTIAAETCGLKGNAGNTGPLKSRFIAVVTAARHCVYLRLRLLNKK